MWWLFACSDPPDPPDPVDPAPTGDTGPAEPSCPGLAGARVCYASDLQPCGPQLVLGFLRSGAARLEIYDEDCVLGHVTPLEWQCVGPGQVDLDGELESWDGGALTTASWGTLTRRDCR